MTLYRQTNVGPISRSTNASPWAKTLVDADEGDRRVINVGGLAEIRSLHKAERVGAKAIAQHPSVAGNTVGQALRFDALPHYERAHRRSASTLMTRNVQPVARVRHVVAPGSSTWMNARAFIRSP
jgi:hypothetical protein